MPDPRLQSIVPTLKQSAFPQKLALELSAHCNFACTMCYYPGLRRPKGIMPFPLWQKCADEVRAASANTEIWFSFCGEPLLQPELLMEMYRYGHDIGLPSLNLNTNGMLLTRDLAEPLLECGVKLIVVGLDGFSKRTYEAIRIGGIRERVYGNVEYLLAVRDRLEAAVEIQVQFIEMDENEHELEAFSEYWLARGATVKLRNKLSWGGKFDTPMNIPAEERIPCPWALTMMHVFWDGRVSRCPGDSEGEEGFGNAWHESLTTIWAQLGVYRDLHLAHRFDELPERCHTCKDWMTGAAVRVRSEGGSEAARERLRRRRRDSIATPEG